MTRVYISGPITGVEDYMQNFDRAEKLLESEGLVVINPARVNAELPKSTSHSDYMTVSIAMESTCDMVYMLKGWEESKGSSIEFEYAYDHKLSIFFER